MPKATITKTRTIGGVKWECTAEEGLWYSTDGVHYIGLSGRKGRRSEWELVKNNETVLFGKTCVELMEAVARKHV